MSDNDKSGSGAPAGTEGGASATNQPGEMPSNTPPKNTVAWNDHQRALNDLHKFKTESATLKEQLDALETEKLKANEDYKAAYEREAEKAKAAETRATNFSKWAINSKKSDSLKTAAVAAGIRKEAMSDLDLLDLDSLPSEITSNNRILIQGVESFVEQLKADKPHWFRKEGPPNINGAGGGAPPTGDGKKYSVDDVVSAEKAWKRGTISHADYMGVHKKYVQQRT